MSSWRKNGQDLAQTSRKWRKKISNGESDGERKIYPSANPAMYLQKMDRSLKLQIKEEEEFRYPCSENKVADQQCTTELRVCFCIGKILMTLLNLFQEVNTIFGVHRNML